VRLEVDDPALAEQLASYLRHGGLAVSPGRPGVVAVHRSVAGDKAAVRRLQLALQIWVARRPTVEVRVVSSSLGVLARLRAFARAA
jgi:hypothetical protein